MHCNLAKRVLASIICGVKKCSVDHKPSPAFHGEGAGKDKRQVLEAFLLSLATGLVAAALFEVLHNPESRKRYSGVARLSGRLFVSDHNRPRHKAALWAVAAMRWAMVALGSGAGSVAAGQILHDLSAGTIEPALPATLALGIVSGLYLVTISQSRGYLIRGIAALAGGLGLAAGIQHLLGGVPSAGEALMAVLVFGLTLAFCWRLFGLIPPLRY